MMHKFTLLFLLLFGAATVLQAQDEWDESGDDWGDDDWGDDITLPEIHGFAELAAAARFDAGPGADEDILLSEARFRLDVSHRGSVADLIVKADFVADDVLGLTDFDLRQAYIDIRAADWLNIRAGRQILTWGTGDFVFLNDLFPKDFVSFFAGRNDEFLKAPATAVKFAIYNGVANVDLVWLPIYTSDRFISGERLTFFNSAAGAIVGPAVLEMPISPQYPRRTLDKGEFAARVYRSVGSAEISLYGSVGFFKQPTAFDVNSGMPTFAPLNTAGASVRLPLLGGLANAEASYYDSADDPDGDNPFIPNSQIRILAGYEHEIVSNLTGAAQYYLEQTADHEALLANSPTPQYEPDENRQWITGRLTLRALRQTLQLGLFGIYSLEEDYHVRATASYQWSDALNLSFGALLMGGEDFSFFGGLKHNSNAFVRVRYGF